MICYTNGEYIAWYSSWVASHPGSVLRTNAPDAPYHYVVKGGWIGAHHERGVKEYIWKAQKARGVLALDEPLVCVIFGWSSELSMEYVLPRGEALPEADRESSLERATEIAIQLEPYCDCVLVFRPTPQELQALKVALDWTEFDNLGDFYVPKIKLRACFAIGHVMRAYYREYAPQKRFFFICDGPLYMPTYRYTRQKLLDNGRLPIIIDDLEDLRDQYGLLVTSRNERIRDTMLASHPDWETEIADLHRKAEKWALTGVWDPSPLFSLNTDWSYYYTGEPLPIGSKLYHVQATTSQFEVSGGIPIGIWDVIYDKGGI